MSKKTYFVLLLFGAMMAAGCEDKGNDGADNGNGFGGQVTLDHVDGLQGAGNIQTGVPITFYIRFNNNTQDTISGFSNGFKVYSPDGARWDTTIGDTTGALNVTQYDGGIFINSFGTDGSGVDTVGFGGFTISSLKGAEPGFDEVVFTIQIGPISSTYSSKTICLDSTTYYPTNIWLWVMIPDNRQVIPTWDGPHCFRIVNP
ncbi:MAG: hypothetical protein ACE5K8_01325 [Candidatus Zixiibacteriota bacterium]